MKKIHVKNSNLSALYVFVAEILYFVSFEFKSPDEYLSKKITSFLITDSNRAFLSRLICLSPATPHKQLLMYDKANDAKPSVKYRILLEFNFATKSVVLDSVNNELEQKLGLFDVMVCLLRSPIL
jgi:hypothetical protein